MLKSSGSIAVLALICVAPLTTACGASNEKDQGPGGLGVDAGDDGGFVITDSSPSIDIGVVSAVTIKPSNAVVTIDLADPAKPAAGVQDYVVTVRNDDGTDTDVTSVAKLAVDSSFGSFTGSKFTSVTALPGGVPGTTTVTADVVDKDGHGKQGAANLTLIALRATGDKRDFFFIEPYGGTPTPDRDVLKFGTNIKQVDVAFILDTTGSMGGVIAGMKTSISGMIPKLKKAIPNVGVAITGHDDFPYDGHGSPGIDLPFYLLQTVTTSVTAAQTATNAYATHSGDDGPESQLEAQYQVLTGEGVNWPGGSIKKKTNAPGTYGYVDFRPGSLPVTVEITDIEWHEQGDYRVGTEPAPHPHSMTDLTDAFKKTHARGVGIAIGTFGGTGGPIPQMTTVAEASNAMVPPSAFTPGCGTGQCCTEEGGAGRAPDASDGKSCLLIFKASYTGTGTSDSIVTAIAALSAGTNFDVTAQPRNDTTNPDGVDATKFIKALRAMDEGDSSQGCPTQAAKDTDGDGVKDTFTGIPVGTPVCFEVIPAKNDFVKPTKAAQFFNAFIDVLGMPGAVNLDERKVLFLVPPSEIIAR
jgi:hypothetical protein